MSCHEVSPKEIAQAIISIINFLEREKIPAWTTTIQKVIFLWLLSKNKARNIYRAYLYGPYSDIVSDMITRLQTLKYLDCDINIYQSIARSYHINRKKISSEILERLRDEYTDLQEILKKLVKINSLNDVKSISNITKIAWIEMFEKVKEYEEIYNILKKKYLWDLSRNDFDNAYRNWQQIKAYICSQD